MFAQADCEAHRPRGSSSPPIRRSNDAISQLLGGAAGVGQQGAGPLRVTALAPRRQRPRQLEARPRQPGKRAGPLVDCDRLGQLLDRFGGAAPERRKHSQVVRDGPEVGGTGAADDDPPGAGQELAVQLRRPLAIAERGDRHRGDRRRGQPAPSGGDTLAGRVQLLPRLLSPPGLGEQQSEERMPDRPLAGAG